MVGVLIDWLLTWGWLLILGGVVVSVFVLAVTTPVSEPEWSGRWECLEYEQRWVEWSDYYVPGFGGTSCEPWSEEGGAFLVCDFCVSRVWVEERGE